MTTKAGISLERLERLDAFLKAKYIDTGILPNTQLLVFRRGELAYQSEQGWADVERGIPLRADHIFRIYSMTKPLTSIAFMMLVEEGKVSLSDPVSSVIPEWARLEVLTGGKLGDFQTEPPKRPMQMVDLLRHTAGLSYHIQQGSPLDAAYRELGLGIKTSLDEFIAALAKLPLDFSPGEAWHYSAATDVVGYLVGKISGQPFEEFLRERILKPLGMVDTDFYVPADKVERFMPCYALTPKGRVIFDGAQQSHYLAPPHFVSGGGGLVGTAADYLRFCRMLLRGGELGGVRLISPKTLKLMTSNHLPGNQDLLGAARSNIAADPVASAGVGFGLGFAVSLDPALSLSLGTAGSYSWGGAAATTFWIDPTEDMAVVFMTQLLMAPETLGREIRTQVYAALTESATGPRSLA